MFGKAAVVGRLRCKFTIRKATYDDKNLEGAGDTGDRGVGKNLNDARAEHELYVVIARND